jgi:hypothetical protein
VRAVAGIAAALLLSSAASAQPKGTVALAKAGAGQPAMAVGFDAKGGLRAQVCAAASCSADQGRELLVPTSLRGRVKEARLKVVPIGRGRRAVVVTIPEPAKERAWEAVIAAPVKGGTEPVIAFEGMTGNAEGEYGGRRGGMVMVSEPRADGTRSIVIGEQREDMALCGRPAVLAPKLLVPDDLSLKPAKVQRLTPGERENAARHVAKRSEEPVGTRFPLLRAIAATSAVGAPWSKPWRRRSSGWRPPIACYSSRCRKTPGRRPARAGASIWTSRCARIASR